jgi:1-acyl-sn-glycerol-3-phosphate acyltransferase
MFPNIPLETALLPDISETPTDLSEPPFHPDRLDNRNPKVIELALDIIESAIIPYHRAEIEGAENIPEGAAMYVGNHNGGLLSIDTFIASYGMYRQGGLNALPYAMCHDLVIDNPLLNTIVAPLGGLRACRENAARVFAAGYKTLVYPGGDIEGLRSFSERNFIKFNGRKGYIKIALKHDIPIIPMVAAGAHSTFLVLHDLEGLPRKVKLDKFLRMDVWPIIFSLPWGITFGPSPPYFPFPSKISVRFLPPIHFERCGQAATEDEDYVTDCANRVEFIMQENLTEMTS